MNRKSSPLNLCSALGLGCPAPGVNPALHFEKDTVRRFRENDRVEYPNGSPASARERQKHKVITRLAVRSLAEQPCNSKSLRDSIRSAPHLRMRIWEKRTPGHLQCGLARHLPEEAKRVVSGLANFREDERETEATSCREILATAGLSKDWVGKTPGRF